ncbi:MAG: DUF2442 domain-containing protein [Fibrobacterota bacterium]
MLKVIHVEARKNHRLYVELSNGKKGLFDVTPYLEKGVFSELNDKNYFKQVKPFFIGISWPHEQDFSADTIEYEMDVDAE